MGGERRPRTPELLAWLALFAAAFGIVEAAVVVYLRELTYPDGFSFPLRPVSARIVATELVREAATLVLLLGVALASVRGGLRRFAAFAFAFGAWDLVYYAGLKLFLDWPESLLTWDVLFLIPVPWTAPVLAPVLVSLALVAAAVRMLTGPPKRLRPLDWLVETAAGLLILLTFFWNLPEVAAGEPPDRYPWPLFFAGLLGGAGWFAWRWRRAG